MASKSLNKVTLIGNLTRDPELKYTPSGTAVCSFGVATNRSWTTADGDVKEDVQFHRIVAWQKLAELTAKLLAKGRKVYLEGRITYRSYVGKDGLEKSITEIIMDDFVVFDDRRKVADSETNDQPVTITHADKPSFNLPEQDKDVVEEKHTKESNEESVSEDDIPF